MTPTMLLWTLLALFAVGGFAFFGLLTWWHKHDHHSKGPRSTTTPDHAAEH